jgi:hypothetical protein
MRNSFHRKEEEERVEAMSSTKTMKEVADVSFFDQSFINIKFSITSKVMNTVTLLDLVTFLKGSLYCFTHIIMAFLPVIIQIDH